MSSKHVALLDMATAINVWVDVDDVGWLSPRAKGGWFPQHDLILLAPGLHPVEELCTPRPRTRACDSRPYNSREWVVCTAPRTNRR